LIRAIKKLLYLAQANLLTTPFVDNSVQNDSAAAAGLKPHAAGGFLLAA